MTRAGMLVCAMLMVTGCGSHYRAYDGVLGYQASNANEDGSMTASYTAEAKRSWESVRALLQQGCAESLGVLPEQVQITAESREESVTTAHVDVPMASGAMVVSGQGANAGHSYDAGYSNERLLVNVPVRVYSGLCQRRAPEL